MRQPPTMLNAVLRILLNAILSLRYRVDIIGLERLEPKDHRGILFLPNHPALIDPLILLCVITARFSVRAVADEQQANRPVIRWLAKRVRTRTLLNSREQGAGSKHRIAAMFRDIVRGLKSGEALVFYPAGRIYRQRFEDLGNNGAVEFLVRSCPDVRVVMVRTYGLWGSGFGRASGHPPTVLGALKRGLIGLVQSGIFFAPRRRISIEFQEPADFPRQADRHTVNRYLSSYYNQGALPNTYVPYSIWERGGTRVVPEPIVVTQSCLDASGEQR
jgi:1-acyl-sn-glycerol-3-phosphate acyltransferase